MNRLFILTALLCALSPSVFAQSGTIQGGVNDSLGKPVAAIFRGDRVEEATFRNIGINELNDETAPVGFPAGVLVIAIWTTILLVATRFRLTRGGLIA